MFTLETNILIGGLIFAAILTYVLILQKIKQKPVFMDKTASGSRGDMSRVKVEKKKPEKEYEIDTLPKTPKPQSVPCAYHFGYLREIPKNSAFPNECLGCPKIVDCLTFAEPEETY